MKRKKLGLIIACVPIISLVVVVLAYIFCWLILGHFVVTGNQGAVFLFGLFIAGLGLASVFFLVCSAIGLSIGIYLFLSDQKS